MQSLSKQAPHHYHNPALSPNLHLQSSYQPIVYLVLELTVTNSETETETKSETETEPETATEPETETETETQDNQINKDNQDMLSAL